MQIENLSLDELAELRKEALVARSREFSPSGFLAFFELLHNIPIHKHGVRWAHEVFEAHEKGLGYLNKAHRESAKSTFAKFFMAFFIGHHPEKSSMIVRINDDVAGETTQAIANIIEYDPRWKRVFPHVVPDKDVAWGAKGYEVKRTDMEGRTEAEKYEAWRQIRTSGLVDPTFVGYGWNSGSIIGSRINGVALIDDIHDTKNTSSARQLKAVKKWHGETFDPCIQEGAFEIWNYTPWLENDLYASQESSGTYMLSSTPVMYEASKDEPGAEMWPEDPMIPLSGKYYVRYLPEFWPWEKLSKKYKRGADDDDSGGHINFARMFLLDLETAKGLDLKSEWIRKYPADQIDSSWPVFMGVDYASTMDKIRDKDRDYFALAIGRALPGGGIVITDGIKKKVSKAEAIKIVLSYWGMYPTTQMIGVENIGKGEEFYNDLLLSVDMVGRIPPLVPIKHGRRSKGDRFENWLAPRCETGRIWFSNVPTPFLTSFYNEWLTYPNAKHDDTIDAVYMCAWTAEGKLARKDPGTGTVKIKRSFNPYASVME